MQFNLRFVIFSHLLLIGLTANLCLAQSVKNSQDPSGERPYSAVQLLDGFGAVFVGIGEPVFFPIDRVKHCNAKYESSLTVTGCGLVGFVVSPFLMLRDALLGTGDIVTGGYYKLSRNAGVFDYFDTQIQENNSQPQNDSQSSAAPSESVAVTNETGNLEYHSYADIVTKAQRDFRPGLSIAELNTINASLVSIPPNAAVYKDALTLRAKVSAAIQTLDRSQ